MPDRWCLNSYRSVCNDKITIYPDKLKEKKGIDMRKLWQLFVFRGTVLRIIAIFGGVDDGFEFRDGILKGNSYIAD